MPRSLSVAQINRLGDRLRAPGMPALVDLQMLQRLRLDYDPPLAEVGRRLRERLGIAATSRLKTIGTIVDKLRREKTRLSRMQDIAGARTVIGGDLSEQDHLADSIAGLFPGSRIIDRRSRPTHGYRAVHVVATVEDCPVEIQVRTDFQDVWAQFLEKIADAWGREIRYGGAPIEPQATIGRGTRQGLVDALMQQSVVFARMEEFLSRVADRGIDSPALEAEWTVLARQAEALLEDFEE